MDRPARLHGDRVCGLTRRDVMQYGTSFGLDAAALTTASVPSTAAAASKRGGHAVVLNYAFPESWDPHLAGTLAVNAVTSPIYNQVVEFDPLQPDNVIGDLAKSWEVQDNGATYIFHLHDNITWHDGKPLTAEDVAFSINRMIEPGQPRPRVGLLRPMTKSAVALDRNTVKVSLKYPSPSFLQFLAVDYMKIVPKHIVEAGTDINKWQNIVGSGPFKIKSVRRGDSIRFERNPNYFKPGLPYLDSLTLISMSDAGTAAAAFRAGKIHMTTGFTTIQVEDVLRLADVLKDKYTLTWQGATGASYIFGNVELQPWRDPRVLKALRLATDLDEMQKAFGAGMYQLGAPFPVGSWYGHSDGELRELPGYRQPKDQDIADAKALLKAVGYDPPSKLGKRVLTTIPVGLFPDQAQLWVAQMRRNLDLTIDIKLVDTPTAVAAYIKGDLDLGIGGYGFNIYDPDDYVNAVYGPGSRNWSRWKHPEFQALLKQQSKESDADKRKALLRQMETFLLTEECPYITLVWGRLFYFFSNQVRTEAGDFVTPPTIQTVLKQEHWWLET